MTRQGYLLAGGVMVMGLIFGAGYWQGIKHQSSSTEQAEARANEAKGEADAFKRQAQAKDAEISDKDHRLDVARSDVARKNAELAKLRALPASAPASAPSGASFLVDQPVSPGVVNLAPLVAKQDEVIASQAGLITVLETRVFDLTNSRDLWKASADAREREVAGLRISLEAQKSLTKGALLKGRIQGLIVGLGSSYIAKRM